MSTLKLYDRLADELAHAIREGHLPGGSALPTQRDFAKQRRIGLSTATRIYAELQRRGLVVGEVGRGTFVRERPIEPHPLSEAIRYTAMARTAEAIDAPTLRQALRSVSALSDIERLATQPTPLGSPSARRALALYLSRWGLKVDPAQIVTTGGGLAAMRLAALVSTQRGHKVAADAVTYPGWRLVSEQLGLEMMPLAFDAQGPVPEALERLCRRARVTALHCMPTAHHPLGWVMPLQRRRDLVALAREHDVTLLEDATYNHLVRGAPPCFAQLAPERTWLIGSLSGAMGDGLRFGYLVAPACWGPGWSGRLCPGAWPPRRWSASWRACGWATARWRRCKARSASMRSSCGRRSPRRGWGRTAPPAPAGCSGWPCRAAAGRRWWLSNCGSKVSMR